MHTTPAADNLECRLTIRLSEANLELIRIDAENNGGKLSNRARMLLLSGLASHGMEETTRIRARELHQELLGE